MKSPKLILVIVVISGFFIAACHKSNGVAVSPASVNVINAIEGDGNNGVGIIPVFGTTDTIQYYASANQIYYQNTSLYSPLSGPNTLYVVGTDDTTVRDPKLRMFSGTLNLAAGGIYSLFFAGDTTKPDTLFIQDHIPVYSDSSAGVRFVNLSPGSGAMTVNIAGNNPVTQQEFSNISYKGVTAFKKYPASSSVGGSYNFMIYNTATGDSIPYTWSYTLFRNNTIVIMGTDNPTTMVESWMGWPMNNF